MLTWANAEAAGCPSTGRLPSLAPRIEEGSPPSLNTFLFAAEHNGEEIRLYLDLLSSEPLPAPRPVPALPPSPAGCRLEYVDAGTPGKLRICLIVRPAPAG